MASFFVFSKKTMSLRLLGNRLAVPSDLYVFGLRPISLLLAYGHKHY